jgi:hypothetical protein
MDFHPAGTPDARDVYSHGGCGPQKLWLTRRWQQHWSGPSTYCLRNLQRLLGLIQSWFFHIPALLVVMS